MITAASTVDLATRWGSLEGGRHWVAVAGWSKRSVLRQRRGERLESPSRAWTMRAQCSATTCSGSAAGLSPLLAMTMFCRSRSRF